MSIPSILWWFYVAAEESASLPVEPDHVGLGSFVPPRHRVAGAGSVYVLVRPVGEGEKGSRTAAPVWVLVAPHGDGTRHAFAEAESMPIPVTLRVPKAMLDAVEERERQVTARIDTLRKAFRRELDDARDQTFHDGYSAALRDAN